MNEPDMLPTCLTPASALAFLPITWEAHRQIPATPQLATPIHDTHWPDMASNSG